MVQAQVYQMTMNAMQTYARKFRSDDIKQSDIEKLYKEVYTNVEKMETTSDTSAQMKSDILNRSNLVEETIQNAYTNNVRGIGRMNAQILNMISLVAFIVAAVTCIPIISDSIF